MDKKKAIALLREQLQRADDAFQNGPDSPGFEKWQRDTQVVIKQIFGDKTDHELRFLNIDYEGYESWTGGGVSGAQAFQSGFGSAKVFLESCIDEVDRFWTEQVAAPTSPGPEACRRIFDRFHKVAKQLEIRHSNRDAHRILDEYDLQDLLHSLLTLYFDDIRPEEWTPSYAGATSRMDFLLKPEKLVIETKMTGPNLSAKTVGDQLLIDIERYKAHPDCTTLLCFIYDLEGRLKNPRGLENDLRRDSPIKVEAFIRPL